MRLRQERSAPTRPRGSAGPKLNEAYAPLPVSPCSVIWNYYQNIELAHRCQTTLARQPPQRGVTDGSRMSAGSRWAYGLLKRAGLAWINASIWATLAARSIQSEP